MQTRWVLASNNQGKLAEFQSLFMPMGVEFIPQASLNIADANETGTTFVENAIIKARHASQQSGLPAIADDSGLCVPILNNAPGVLSARFAGSNIEHKDGFDKDVLNKGGLNKDRANNDKLQQMLLPYHQQRQTITAFFVCVLVFLRTSDDPLPIIAEGHWYGQITAAPKGEQGFGYDSLFLVPDLGKTAAELDTATKNALSHRGQAMQQLKQKLAVLGIGV